MLSRIAVATYGRFPVFGPLRSSTGVLLKDGCYLVLDRSDRLGYAFPGGLAWPWEDDERTVRREFREETGLKVTSARFLFRYHDHHYLPGRICVFEVAASGELQRSWEGIPVFLPIEAIRKGVFASHEEIADYLLRTRSTPP